MHWVNLANQTILWTGEPYVPGWNASQAILKLVAKHEALQDHMSECENQECANCNDAQTLDDGEFPDEGTELDIVDGVLADMREQIGPIVAQAFKSAQLNMRYGSQDSKQKLVYKFLDEVLSDEEWKYIMDSARNCNVMVYGLWHANVSGTKVSVNWLKEYFKEYL